MGYDVHITRADYWDESEDHPISVNEWLDTVAADPELTLDPANGPYSARWEATDVADPGWFDWSEGNIYTTDPSEADITKMLALARLLSAIVQGDDGKLYGQT